VTTSGTVARTSIDVATVVEHAVRKCGVPTSSITGEQLRTARENLFFILTGLTNRGLNLWCQQKQIQPVVGMQSRYPLWAGTVDILNALYRTGTYTAATAYLGAVATVTFTTGTIVTSVSVVAPSNGTYNLVLESSDNGSSWTQRGSTSMLSPSVAGDRLAVDTESFVTAVYWRVRETALAVTVTSATFLSSTNDIPMSPLNRDDYQSLPNKGFSSSVSLQYWFDKQTASQLWLWPVSQSEGPQIVLTVQRQIQDVGALTNTLDVPQRWLPAIIHELGASTCLELPAAMVPPGRFEQLTALAQRFVREAEDGEVDGAPIRLMPAIGAYTRS
jgi:hypothetical protein